MQMRAYESVTSDTWTATADGFSNWNRKIHFFTKKKKKKECYICARNQTSSLVSILYQFLLFILPFSYYAVELSTLLYVARDD